MASIDNKRSNLGLLVRFSNVKAMARRLPNLNQLRAFEAAARHLSFRDAADELFVTHSAISQQIRALEEHFGCSLFIRHARQVTLTDHARDLAKTLTSTFDEIAEQATHLAASQMSGKIRLSSSPFYANRMILPRLAEFYGLYPDLEVEFEFTYALSDFRAENIDGALRYGPGDWTGVRSRIIHYDRVVPVASAIFAASLALPLDPADIAQLPLAAVRGQTQYWDQWFEAAGIKPPEDAEMSLHDHRGLALDYAAASNAVALADLPLIRNELKTGALVKLSDIEITLDRGVHLSEPDGPMPDLRLQAFADWLLEIVNESDAE